MGALNNEIYGFVLKKHLNNEIRTINTPIMFTLKFPNLRIRPCERINKEGGKLGFPQRSTTLPRLKEHKAACYFAKSLVAEHMWAPMCRDQQMHGKKVGWADVNIVG